MRAAPHAARVWGVKRSGDSQAAGALKFVNGESSIENPWFFY